MQRSHLITLLVSVALAVTVPPCPAEPAQDAPTVSILRLKSKQSRPIAEIYEIQGETTVEANKAKSISAIFRRPGNAPPAMLDVYNGSCGIKVNGKVYCVVMFSHRGIQVREASIRGKELRVTGKRRVLGRIPKLAAFLNEILMEMAKEGSDPLQNEQAEQVEAPDAE